MNNNQLTQLNTDNTVVLSASVSSKESVPLETATKQGDLALLGTIQALSSVTEELAPTETQNSTTEYSAPLTDDTSDNLSYRGLIGGSALSMASLSLINLQQNLLKISLYAMEESWLSNEALNSTAQQQYSLSLDAAEESYKAGMAQANSELTACITSGISAAGTGYMAGRELSNMSKASNDMAKYKAEKNHLEKLPDGHPGLENPIDPEPVAVAREGEGIEAIDAQKARRTAIKEALIRNRGNDLSTDQRARFADAAPDDFAEAKNMYNRDKIRDIDAAMRPGGPGTLNDPVITDKYGDIDVYNDKIAQYALRKTAHDMSPEELREARDKSQGHYDEASRKFTEANTRLSQGSQILREAMDSIKGGIQANFTMEKAKHDKQAAEENAEASLYKSASDQFSSLQGTWRNLNSTYYDQATSWLQNQMAALVKANSLN